MALEHFDNYFSDMGSPKVEGCFCPVEKCPLNSISWWLVTDSPAANPGFDPGTSEKQTNF